MTQTTILAAGTTEATSSDVVVAAGATATIGIFTTAGEIRHDHRALVMQDTPGGDVFVEELGPKHLQSVISGPGTFRVVCKAHNAPLGIFQEA